MPTVRSSVLLPDMFEPLTTSTVQVAAEAQVVAHAAVAGSSGWPSLRREDAALATISGKGSSGFS